MTAWALTLLLLLTAPGGLCVLESKSAADAYFARLFDDGLIDLDAGLPGIRRDEKFTVSGFKACIGSQNTLYYRLIQIVRLNQNRRKEVRNMECKIKNDLGTIYIAEDVMLKIVGYAALECYGIVAMCSKRAKDGLVEWLGRENLSKGVQVRLVDDQLDVDLFIVVEYGISVAEVCKTIVEVVRYKLESMTGVKVRSVNISVEGIRI